MNGREFPGLQLVEYCRAQIKSRRAPKSGGHPMDWEADWKFMLDMDDLRGEHKPGTHRNYTVREAAETLHERDHPGWRIKNRRDGVDPIRAYVERYHRVVSRIYSDEYNRSDWAF